MIHTLDPLKKSGHARPTTQKTTRKTSASFKEALHVPEQAQTVEETSSLHALTMVLPFLTSHTGDDALDVQQRLAQGHHMLKQLDILRDGLLTGRYTPAALTELKDCLNRMTLEQTSGEIVDIVQEIRLRVAVECEKFQRTSARSA